MTKLSMARPVLCLLALLLLAVPINVYGFSPIVEAAWPVTYSRTASMTGPSIVWKYLTLTSDNRKTITDAITNDVNNLLPWNINCHNPTLSSFDVNDTGCFIVLDFLTCSTDSFNDYFLNRTYSSTQSAIQNLMTNEFGNLSILWGKTVTTLTDTFLRPGVVPPPLPPGTVNSTSNNQTVMLSGGFTGWQNALSQFNSTSVSAAIAEDFAASLGHHGATVITTVESMTPHTADPTKMLPGDGNSGLTVNVMINQSITDTSVYQYDMHAMSAALMSASMTQTSAVYNKANAGASPVTIKLVAAYEDIPYNTLDCTSACIVALTVAVSVVYLMLMVVIVTIVATQCYLINDFDFKELAQMTGNFF